MGTLSTISRTTDDYWKQADGNVRRHAFQLGGPVKSDGNIQFRVAAVVEYFDQKVKDLVCTQT